MSKNEQFDIADTIYQVVIRNHGRKLLMKKRFKKNLKLKNFTMSVMTISRLLDLTVLKTVDVIL